MTKRRVTEGGEESRQKILDAAEELFLECGYDKTTLNAVGKRCGISYGSIPWHFGNKAGLLFAVVQRIAIEQVSGTSAPLSPQTRYEPGLPGLEQLMASISQWDDDPRLPLLHMLDAAFDEAPPEIVRTLVETDQQRFRNVESWAARTLAMNSHVSPVDPDGIAKVFVASVRGISILSRIEGDFFDLRKARESLRGTMIALLGLDNPRD